jgi:hypothetical protein
MTDLKWRGLGVPGNYVSADGRFLVAQSEVPSKKKAGATVKVWALYGRVDTISTAGGPLAPWTWEERPLAVCKAKKDAQAQAAGYDDYEPPTRALAWLPTDAASHVASAPEAALNGRSRGWANCQECGVKFDRPAGWIYQDYCGANCTETATARVAEIIAALQSARAHVARQRYHGRHTQDREDAQDWWQKYGHLEAPQTTKGKRVV